MAADIPFWPPDMPADGTVTGWSEDGHTIVYQLRPSGTLSWTVECSFGFEADAPCSIEQDDWHRFSGSRANAPDSFCVVAHSLEVYLSPEVSFWAYDWPEGDQPYILRLPVAWRRHFRREASPDESLWELDLKAAEGLVATDWFPEQLSDELLRLQVMSIFVRRHLLAWQALLKGKSTAEISIILTATEAITPLLDPSTADWWFGPEERYLSGFNAAIENNLRVYVAPIRAMQKRKNDAR